MFIKLHRQLHSVMGDAAGGAGGDSTPPPTGAPSTPPAGDTYTPPEWAKGLTIEKDILSAPMFNTIKSIDDVVKGYYHAQKMVGADKIVIPTKDSSAEEWKAFYQKGGLPSKIEEYSVEFPSTIDDENFKKNLVNKAYEMNIRPDQLLSIIQEMEAHSDSIVKAYDEEEANNKKAVGDKFAKEWGAAYKQNMIMAQRAIQHFGGDDMLKTVLESPLASNEQFIRLMHKVGSGLLKEDEFTKDIKGSFGLSKEDAQREVNKITGDMNSPYYNRDHAQHKDFVEKVSSFYKIISQN